MTVRVERDGEVAVLTIDWPATRNAVDRPTAQALMLAGTGTFGQPEPCRVPVP